MPWTQIARRAAIACHIKPNCRYMDFAGNLNRHGPVDMIEPKVPGKGDGEAPIKICPQDEGGCGEQLHASVRCCWKCVGVGLAHHATASSTQLSKSDRRVVQMILGSPSRRGPRKFESFKELPVNWTPHLTLRGMDITASVSNRTVYIDSTRRAAGAMHGANSSRSPTSPPMRVGAKTAPPI